MLYKIVKCTDEKGWYKDLIDQVFDTDDNISYTIKNESCQKKKMYIPYTKRIDTTGFYTKWKSIHFESYLNTITYYYCNTNFNKNKKIIIDIKYRMILIDDVVKLSDAEVRKYKIKELKNGIRKGNI